MGSTFETVCQLALALSGGPRPAVEHSPGRPAPGPGGGLAGSRAQAPGRGVRQRTRRGTPRRGRAEGTL